MGKAKRAHLYPVMGTGTCPLLRGCEDFVLVAATLVAIF